MKTVIIMVETARAVGRKFLRGIERYTKSAAKWEVCVRPPDYLPTNQFNTHSWFQLQEANGLIALASKFTADILQLKIPKIIHNTQKERPKISKLYTNSEKIGQLAAQYFIGLGFKNFAFCGFKRLAWSDTRFRKFASCLKESGFDNIFNYHQWPGSAQKKETERSNIAQWRKSLPKPVCVFACNDDR